MLMQSVLAHEFQINMELTYDWDGNFRKIGAIFPEKHSLKSCQLWTSHETISVREQGTLFWLAFLHHGVTMVLAGVQPSHRRKTWVNTWALSQSGHRPKTGTGWWWSTAKISPSFEANYSSMPEISLQSTGHRNKRTNKLKKGSK